MKFTTLGQVAVIERKAATETECSGLPYVGLEDIEKGTGHFAPSFSIKPQNMLATNFRFTPEHVLYGKLRPYLNKVVCPNFDGVCTTEVLPIRPLKGKLDKKYLWTFLLTPRFIEWASASVSGANLPRLDPKLLEECELPLPPLPEQQRIAALLSKADRLRRLRRYALEMSEGYLQAVFVQMFGDPVTNPMGWDVVELEELCEKVIDCPHATPIYSTEQTPYACIRSSDIQGGHLDWSTTKYLSYDEYLKRIIRLKPQQSDILYCREGARFGNAALIPPNVTICLGQRMMLFRTDPNKAISEFVWAFLESRSVYHLAVRLAGGSASPHVNVEDIKAFPAIVPPIKLQRNFSLLVRNHERLRNQQREALRQAEHLFQTLLARAFGKT